MRTTNPTNGGNNMDETETSFWSKKPDELTVGDQIKFVALVPAVMLGSIIGVGAVLTGVEKIRARLSRKQKVELTLVETPDEEVQ
jgi:hypothetical protein